MSKINEMIKKTVTNAVDEMIDIEAYGWPVCWAIFYQPERPITEEE